MSGSAVRLAASMANGRGRVLPIFGARTAASAPSLPLPLRSRKRPKARMPASARMSERLPILPARRAAEVLGKKLQELQHVAPIGFEGLGRQAPLGAEMAQPSLDLGRHFGRHE